MLETTYSIKVSPAIDQTELLRTLSGPVWKTSRDEDCTAPLGKLLHCVAVLMVKEIPLNPLEASAASSYPHCLFSSHLWKILAPPSLSLHYRCWNAAARFPLSLLFCRLTGLLFAQPLLTGTCCSSQPSCWSSAELTPIACCPSV